MISARFALLTLTLALVAVVGFTLPNNARSQTEIVICIDPGHGGTEPGAVNGALIERDINLDISRYLMNYWNSQVGFRVEMTRTEDSAHSIRDRYTFCNATGADLLLSVHTNSVANASIDGTLTIYFHRDDKVLAEFLHAALEPAMRADAPAPFTDFGVRRDALGMVLKSDMPAAVVEPVMMSDPWEAQELATSIAECEAGDLCRRLQIATSIIAGVTAYLGANPPDSGGGGDAGGPPCSKRPGHATCNPDR